MANTTFSDENTFCPSVPRRKGKADLLSTKTNMANTTFSDKNTFCPSVPRKKGRADLLSTKTNMANTTFSDENTLCLPCNNAETMENVRKRVTIDIAREIYSKTVFSRGGQPQSAYDETCTFLFKHYADDVALFLANKIERGLAIDQTFTPTRKSEEYIITNPVFLHSSDSSVSRNDMG
jgi:hypothetical protein